MSAHRRITSTIAFLLTVCAGVAGAAVLTVPTTHGSLAAAIADARPGDVIEVQPGTYFEHGLVVRQGVTIRGLGPLPEDVVIDGEHLGRILACVAAQEPVVLLNMTLRNGSAQGRTSRQRSGGAVFVDRCDLVVQNCRFETNRAGSHGGAIRFVHGGGRISQSDFIANEAALGGGAVDCSYDSAPTLDRCELRENRAGWGGALSCRVDSSPTVIRTEFRNNRTGNVYGFGGAVFADHRAGPRLQICTMVGNQAAFGGAVGCFQGSFVDIDRCTIVRNSSLGMGGGLYCVDSSPWVTRTIIAFQSGTGVESVGYPLPQLGCSNLYGNSGGNTRGPSTGAGAAAPPINVDPLFCGAAADSDHPLVLAPESPSADGPCGLMGAWPAVCAMSPVAATQLVPEVQGDRTTVRWSPVIDHPDARYRVTWTRPGAPERGLLVEETSDNTFLARTQEPVVADPAVRFRLYVRDGQEPWVLVREGGYQTGAADKAGDGVPAVAPLAVRNWPNPFNPATTIGVSVGRPQRTRVAVYDLEGRLVRMLADRVFTAGETQIAWDGRDDGDRGVSAGAYLVQVRSGVENRTHKITLLK